MGKYKQYLELQEEGSLAGLDKPHPNDYHPSDFQRPVEVEPGSVFLVGNPAVYACLSVEDQSAGKICHIDSEGALIIPRGEQGELRVPAEELARWRGGDFSQTTLSMSEITEVASCFARVLVVLCQGW